MRWCFDSLYPCGWWMEQLVIVVGAHPRKVITFRSLILMSLNSAAWPPKIGDFSVNAPNNNSNRIYIAPWCSEDTEALELTWVYCMSTPTTLAVTTVVARHTIIIIIIHSNSNYKEIYPFITSFIHVTTQIWRHVACFGNNRDVACRQWTKLWRQCGRDCPVCYSTSLTPEATTPSYAARQSY